MFSDISSRVQENLSGVRVIRAYAQENAEIRKFELLNQDYVAQNIRLARLSAFFMPLLQALIGFGIPDRALGRRLSAARASHFAGKFRDVQHLYGNAGVAHDRLGLGGEPDAARYRLLEPDHGADAREAEYHEEGIQGIPGRQGIQGSPRRAPVRRRRDEVSFGLCAEEHPR